MSHSTKLRLEILLKIITFRKRGNSELENCNSFVHWSCSFVVVAVGDILVEGSLAGSFLVGGILVEDIPVEGNPVEGILVEGNLVGGYFVGDSFVEGNLVGEHFEWAVEALVGLVGEQWVSEVPEPEACCSAVVYSFQLQLSLLPL